MDLWRVCFLSGTHFIGINLPNAEVGDHSNNVKSIVFDDDEVDLYDEVVDLVDNPPLVSPIAPKKQSMKYAELIAVWCYCLTKILVNL